MNPIVDSTEKFCVYDELEFCENVTLFHHGGVTFLRKLVLVSLETPVGLMTRRPQPARSTSESETIQARGTRIKPKPDQQREWAPRQHNYSIQDIDIILTSLAIHSGGKPAQPDVERVNRWLEMTSQAGFTSVL